MSLITAARDTEEEFAKNHYSPFSYWQFPTDQIQPSKEILPLVVAVLSFLNAARISTFLFKRDIQILTEAAEQEKIILTCDPPLDPSFLEVQKETIQTARRLTMYKVIAKIALISSLATLSLAEYWSLSGAPVHNLRTYGLIGSLASGAFAAYQYSYFGVEGLLLERMRELRED